MKSKLLIGLSLISVVLGSTLLTIGFQIDGLLQDEFQRAGIIGLGIAVVFTVASIIVIQQERAELFD
jgi:uncharacterized membrane protein YcjF (UPF0283 family)